MSRGSRRRSGPVVFDGSILGASAITGVGRVFLNALEAYGNLEDAPPTVLMLPGDASVPTLPEAILVVPSAPAGWRGRLRMPAQLRALNATLLHSPVVAIPPRASCPVVATVHDLPWMERPRLVGEGRAVSSRARLAVRFAARFADTLLCVSRHTRHHLVHYLGQRPRARIRVVANAASPALAARPSDDWGTGCLIAFVDHGRARKNTDRVRRAHARAQREAGSIVPPLELLGPPDNYVTEAKKHDLLTRARALLHVTLFDGFGLPIVEAFQRGVPVVCSDRGALPEIAPDGTALRVDPTDERAIAAAIVRVCTDVDLRVALRKKGLARGADFTPDKTAMAWRRIHTELLV